MQADIKQALLVKLVNIWQPFFFYFINIFLIKLAKREYIAKITSKWYTTVHRLKVLYILLYCPLCQKQGIKPPAGELTNFLLSL